MKVLFVSSGKNNGEPGIIVKNQADSIRKIGHEIVFFTIRDKGFAGYLRNILKLKNFIKLIQPDLVHAHYSLAGVIASLTFSGKPVVVSLMGSDVQQNQLSKFIARFFSVFFWKRIIVKSESIKKRIRIKRASIIPNGVDINKIVLLEAEMPFDLLNIDNNKNIIFVSDPSRKEKNFPLAEKAVKKLSGHTKIQLTPVFNKCHTEVLKYMLSADALLLTSKYEGSPNVIKEAMSCNLPIVTTDVGDVEDVIGDTRGCYICKANAEELASSMLKALEFGKPTVGRKRIISLSLDEYSIARKIEKMYLDAINN